MPSDSMETATRSAGVFPSSLEELVARHQTAFSHRDEAASLTDDHVIEHLDIEKGACFLQPLRDLVAFG